MKRIIQSKTIINFPEYPVGNYNDSHFKLPKDSEYISLHFDRQGYVRCMEVIYRSNHTIELTVDHEYFSSPTKEGECKHYRMGDSTLKLGTCTTCGERQPKDTEQYNPVKPEDK